MKSVGETLKEAREERKLDIGQIAQDTNISREYLRALEGEQFDIFPAETYLLGFLRNYSEYLGLDPEKMTGLYKNYKIGEEPAPLEALVGTPRHFKLPLRGMLIAVIILLMAAGGWYGWTHLSFPSLGKDAPQTEKAHEPKQYELKQNKGEWTVHTGDSILIRYGNESVSMAISCEGQHLKIQPAGRASALDLMEGDEKILPGGEGLPAIRLRLKSLKDGEALLSAVLSAMPAQEDSSSRALDSELVAPESTLEEISKKEALVILENRSAPEDFTMNVLFKGFCYFRYEADDSSPVQKFYREDERIRHDISRTLIFGWSSGGDVSIKIAGTSVSSGASGEVGICSVKWVKDEGGRYDLVLVPLK